MVSITQKRKFTKKIKHRKLSGQPFFIEKHNCMVTTSVNPKFLFTSPYLKRKRDSLTHFRTKQRWGIVRSNKLNVALRSRYLVHYIECWYPIICIRV